MQIIQVKISELKSAEYNPRKWEGKDIEDLKQSIQEFGLVDPIIVNSAENRRNIVIGGHFRLYIASSLGYTEVPVVYVDIADIEKEKKLNLRLNKNNGKWDWELLANYDRDFLVESGFSDEELRINLNLQATDEQFLDPMRLEVITVEPPEAPKLKERASIYCDSIENYKKIKEGIQSGKITESHLLQLL